MNESNAENREIEVSQDTQDLLKQILDADTKDLLELAKIAGLDPLKDYAGSNLSEANLSGINLGTANLSGANLSRANLSEANLSEANLSEANLSEANLTGANLTGANLTGANLTGANLTGAKLSRTDLVRVNLSDAVLNNATLTASSIRDTNLSRVDLTSAFVEGTRFREIEGLSEAARSELRDRGAIFVDDIQEVLLGWGTLDESDIEWLISAGEERELPDGTTLIQENVPIEALYIVLRGKLEVSVTANTIARLSSGEVVGEMSFVRTPLPPSATVKATQNSCVWSINRQILIDKTEEDREFGCRFYKALAIVLSIRLQQITLAGIEERKLPPNTQSFRISRQASVDPNNTNLASLLINGSIDKSRWSKVQSSPRADDTSRSKK